MSTGAAIPTIGIPEKTLLHIRHLARDAEAPRITWSEDRARMDREAMQARGDALKAIASELEPFLLDR